MCALVMSDNELDQVFMEIDLEQKEPGNNCNCNETLSKSHVPFAFASEFWLAGMLAVDGNQLYNL